MVKGSKMTEEQRKRLSDAHKGQVAWNKGLTPSKEELYRLKTMNIGKKQTEEEKK